MSIYSADSLENINRNIKIDNTSDGNNIVINLKQKETKLQNRPSFYLKHVSSLSASINSKNYLLFLIFDETLVFALIVKRIPI